MKELIALALEEKASGKTLRYFLSNHEESVVKLANTVEALRNAGKNSLIKTNSGEYFPEEYMLPANLVDYINTKQVYFNPEAVGFGEFVPVTSEDVKLEGEDSLLSTWRRKFSATTDVFSPEQVSAFFKKFNENQDEADKIDLVKVDFMRLNLSDFKELVVKTDDGSGFALVNWNSTGTKEGYLSILANLQSPVNAKYLANSKMPNVEEVVAWMFRR